MTTVHFLAELATRSSILIMSGVLLLRESRATNQATEGIEIRDSDHVASPVVLGYARSSIVLPGNWREWNTAQLDAVLVLWYNPLSWFMHRCVVRAASWQGVPATLLRGVTRRAVAAILLLGSPLAYVVAAARPQSAPQIQPAPSADPWQREAQGHMSKGELDEANAVVDHRLNANPNDSTALLMKSAVLLRQGQYDQSRALLKKLLDANPVNSDALLELGVLDLAQKRDREAEEVFRRAYTIDPSTLRGLLGMAAARFDRNEAAQAVQVIADEVRKQPQRVDLKKELANVELRAEQFAKAVADYQSILKQYKNSAVDQAEVYSGIAYGYSALGNYQGAIDNAQKAAQLVPANSLYLSHLAQLYDSVGRQQEALTAWRGALKFEPDNGSFLNNLAWDIAQQGGDLDEALAMAQRSRQRLPKVNETLDTIGWIYLKKHLTASAIKVFQELNHDVPDNPTFHYHYAMALAQKGDVAGALRELNTALRYHPDQREEKEIKELIRSLSL